MAKGILERLADGPVLGDGGYLLELEKRGYVQAGPFTPEVVIEHPEALEQLHREFLRAGAEVLQTMTFYASDDKLATVGMQGKVDDINRNAVQIARRVAAEGDALVAGNLSLTWAYEPDDDASADHVRRLLDRQLEDQTAAGGVDFWIGETFWNFGEALLCLERLKAKSKLPTMITLSFRATNRLDDGVTAAEAARRLVDAGADIVGTNCMRDPERTYPIVAEMQAAVKNDAFIAAQPVAFRTSQEVPWFTGTSAFPDKLEPIQLTRYEMGDFARRAKEMGIHYIGGCCGTVGSHIREMAKALGKYQAEQVWQARPDAAMSETEHNWARRGARAPGQVERIPTSP